MPLGKQLEHFPGRSLEKLTLQAVPNHRLVAFAATGSFLNAASSEQSALDHRVLVTGIAGLLRPKKIPRLDPSACALE